MPEILSEEWLSALAEALGRLPVVEFASGVVQTEVSGAPSGKVTFHEVYESGRLTELASGKHAEPNVVLMWKFADYEAAVSGELSLEVAFMRGQVKVEGDHSLYFDTMRAVRATDDYLGAIAALRTATVSGS